MANQDGDLNIRINTSADPKGIEQTKKGLAGLLDDFKAAPGLMAKATVAIGAATAAFAALRAAINFAKDAYKEFSEDEVRFRSWAQAAANNGKLTQAFADQVGDLANKMEKVTRIEGDKWMAAFEEVTKRGADSNNIDRIADGIANLAGIMGKDGDIETAARILGQAMDGNRMHLKRWGISVDESKTKTEQFDHILEQLAVRGMGILEKRAATLKGASEGVGIAWDNLKETVGGLIARTGILQGTFSFLTDAFNELNDLLPETKHKIDDLKNASPELAKKLKEAGEAAADGSEGVKDAASALDKLKKSYDEAAAAADEFRKQQDSLEDASTSAALAEIDFLEETQQITPDNARMARAGIKRDSAQRKAAREIAAVEAEQKKLASDRTMAEIDVYRTEPAAKFKGGFRDALMEKARRHFWLDDANELRDPTRFEELMSGPGYWEQELERFNSHRGDLDRWNYSNSILGIEKGRRTEGDMTRIEALILQKVEEEKGFQSLRIFQR